MKSSFLRLLRSGFLVFCFLLSSQAALVHAYTHMGQLGASATASEAPESPAKEGACKLCQSAGQYENALTSGSTLACVVALPHAAPQPLKVTVLVTDPLAPCARGPPFFH